MPGRAGRKREAHASFYHDGHAPRRWLLGIVLLALVACACGPEARRVETYNPDGASALPSSPTALPSTTSRRTRRSSRPRGTPVVVNVWASCAVRAGGGPALAAASTEYGDRVQFLGLDVWTRSGRPRLHRGVRVVLPEPLRPDGSIRDHWAPRPAVTIFYDSEGNVVQTHVGAIEPDELTRQLDLLLEA